MYRKKMNPSFLKSEDRNRDPFDLENENGLTTHLPLIFGSWKFQLQLDPADVLYILWPSQLNISYIVCGLLNILTVSN